MASLRNVKIIVEFRKRNWYGMSKGLAKITLDCNIFNKKSEIEEKIVLNDYEVNVLAAVRRAVKVREFKFFNT